MNAAPPMLVHMTGDVQAREAVLHDAHVTKALVRKALSRRMRIAIRSMIPFDLDAGRIMSRASDSRCIRLTRHTVVDACTRRMMDGIQHLAMIHTDGEDWASRSLQWRIRHVPTPIGTTDGHVDTLTTVASMMDVVIEALSPSSVMIDQDLVDHAGEAVAERMIDRPLVLHEGVTGRITLPGNVVAWPGPLGGPFMAIDTGHEQLDASILQIDGRVAMIGRTSLMHDDGDPPMRAVSIHLDPHIRRGATITPVFSPYDPGCDPVETLRSMRHLQRAMGAQS